MSKAHLRVREVAKGKDRSADQNRDDGTVTPFDHSLHIPAESCLFRETRNDRPHYDQGEKCDCRHFRDIWHLLFWRQ